MTTPGKGRIFISYRRADSAGYAGRIYDRLTAHFGEDTVFMDVDTIEAGLDFVKVLQDAVQSCDVLVALIGRNWLDIKDETGKRRLDNPEDFVRVEIAAALSRDIRVIPVLVDGAPMPRSTELPDNLKPLARRNALQVDHQSFNVDAHRLIAQLELALKAAEEKKKQEAAEKAAHEKEERARLAAEEKKRAESRERAALEERERRAAEERARKEKEVPVGQASSLTRSWLPYGIAGGVILAIAILFGIGALIRYAYAPTSPTTLTKSPPPNPSVGSTWIQTIDGMTMVYVPAGEFQMGNTVEDALADCEKVGNICQLDWFKEEEPPHTVYLNAFWIDQTEVTNAMYARCVEAGECNPPSSTKSYTRDNYYGNPEFNDYPVIYVSWNDAQTYCKWADRRLPTEAEWEKAASWDENKQAKTVYPWGDSIDCSQANYSDMDGCVGDTTAVESYKSGQSPYSAYDMAGNVWEWVLDWYDESYYSISPSSNPMGPNTGRDRMMRGGSWAYVYYFARSAERYALNPSSSEFFIGFRCARSAASP